MKGRIKGRVTKVNEKGDTTTAALAAESSILVLLPCLPPHIIGGHLSNEVGTNNKNDHNPHLESWLRRQQRQDERCGNCGKKGHKKTTCTEKNVGHMIGQNKRLMKTIITVKSNKKRKPNDNDEDEDDEEEDDEEEREELIRS